MNAPAVDSLSARVLAGERRALARAITLIESGSPDARPLLGAIQPRLGNARVVGFTGAPGVGKSTLISAYIGELRRRGTRVAVAAVDPSSPISGGAILGDRVRMSEHDGDDGVFIRSIAARGHLGGLSATTAQVIDLLDAAGWQTIVIETVGAGQSEVEIARIADVTVVVSAPGLGDDIQAIKAGILEIADVLVVNKADQPLAEMTVKQLVMMLGLRGRDHVAAIPVLATVATTGKGITQLADAIERRFDERAVGNKRQHAACRLQHVIANAAAERLKRQLEARTDPAIDDLCNQVARGDLTIDQAAGALLASPSAAAE